MSKRRQGPKAAAPADPEPTVLAVAILPAGGASYRLARMRVPVSAVTDHAEISEPEFLSELLPRASNALEKEALP